MKDSFEETLLNGDEDALNELRRWLFEENIRLTIQKKELDEMKDKFIKEKNAFQDEMRHINIKTVNERKRLKDEENFFDKKMAILKQGYASLQAERAMFEREKREFESEKRITREVRNTMAYEDLTGSLFAGVNSFLALKKRYRDLVKIFHPDNLCGDTEMVTLITKEYERLKAEYDSNLRFYK